MGKSLGLGMRINRGEANVHDKHLQADLLHGAEKRGYGDRGYQGCTG